VPLFITPVLYSNEGALTTYPMNLQSAEPVTGRDITSLGMLTIASHNPFEYTTVEPILYSVPVIYSLNAV